jgi:hypothetical protein
MRKPFSAAVDLYRSLENKSTELVFKVLQFEPHDILAAESCPACFGPRPPNAQDYPDSTRDKLIVCLDGNFQHRHHANASHDYRPLQTPRIFLKADEFEDMKIAIRNKEIELSPPTKVNFALLLFICRLLDSFTKRLFNSSKFGYHQANRCADSHKAADDKRNEATWKGCDDTGLMGCCCRHDSAIYMGNIFKSGEQRCLPIAIIKRLLSECGEERNIRILYNIGCSLDKYMSGVSQIPLNIS